MCFVERYMSELWCTSRTDTGRADNNIVFYNRGTLLQGLQLLRSTLWHVCQQDPLRSFQCVGWNWEMKYTNAYRSLQRCSKDVALQFWWRRHFVLYVKHRRKGLVSCCTNAELPRYLAAKLMASPLNPAFGQLTVDEVKYSSKNLQLQQRSRSP